MESHPSSPGKSHLDETVQVHAATPAEAPAACPSDGECRPGLALVEGSAPGLDSQTHLVVQRRMQIASLMLFSGYAVFLIRALITGRTNFDLTFQAHVTMTIVTGIIGLRICMKCPHMLRHVRIAELFVFGGSAIFFAIWTHSTILEGLQLGLAAHFIPPWLTLIFTYALVIPNSWRRAAIVIGLMAAGPICVQNYILSTEVQYASLLKSVPNLQAGDTALVILMNAVIAVWGVHTIGRLRKKVFEAEQLGQYRLGEKIGHGGMGDVYLAEHLLLKRPCALKLIRPERAGDAKALARFEREVQATAKLTHWNTVEIFDYGRADDGTFYYVMEYLPGMNLSELVQLCGKLPPGRVIHLLEQTCQALAEAHEQGLIHRDIKPGNIFAATRGGVNDVAKLLDFGLVKPVSAKGENVELTQEGAITGSPLYMSPEQATGDESDARSDIYSLGAVAYFLLTGRPPFYSVVPIKVVLAHVSQIPKPPSEIADDVPSDLEAVILRCLEKKPADRFQSAEELRSALQSCEAASDWSREAATDWWENHGCPEKKKLDERVLEAASV